MSIDRNKHIWEGWTVGHFIDDLEVIFNLEKHRLNKDNIKQWCMSNQPYYKKYIPEVVKHFKDKLNK